MGKYNNVLNMHTANSASLLLRSVKPYTTVLEFGADNGYMTQYLKETLKCKVHIVEINQENAEIAKQYADSCLMGDHDGDIEKYLWTGIEKCDHIIFADVLEHLTNPWKALHESSKLLKENGTILISVPNVGHNSVIIDLINNKFDYRELGLLDNTHLRFFTRISLTRMVQDLGLQISREMNTYCDVKHTEFGNDYSDVAPEIENILRAREDGNIYQFVWELKLQ